MVRTKSVWKFTKYKIQWFSDQTCQQKHGKLALYYKLLNFE